MSEFDDKLNSILSSPKDMEKIMGLARELSGSLGGDRGGETSPAPSAPSGGMDIDPKLLKLMTRVMGEYNSSEYDKAGLVNSLKPYLKEWRRADLDRAVKIAKLARIARTAFTEFGGDFRL